MRLKGLNNLLESKQHQRQGNTCFLGKEHVIFDQMIAQNHSLAVALNKKIKKRFHRTEVSLRTSQLDKFAAKVLQIFILS